jgi:hypothetical protein
VSGLKAQGLFTPEVAASVKQAAVQDVLANLGPLKEKVAKLFDAWQLETIVGLAIEKYVVAAKSGQDRPGVDCREDVISIN